jgi:hypothetical protein
MKTNKIIYWIATGILCLIMTFSASMYLFNHEIAAEFFRNLGFPTWIIYPSATAKILAVIAILSKKSKLLKEWAYAGMSLDMVLAFTAHYMAEDGGGGMAATGLIALLVSRYFDWKIYGPL